MNLMAMANELNRKYFLNVLNIDKVSVTKKADSFFPDNDKVVAYYSGDRCSGRVVFIAERFRYLDEEAVRNILFHEMVRQLDPGNGPHFQVLIKQYERGATELESLEFARALKETIELKAKNGSLKNSDMLPAVAKAAIRKVKLAKAKEDITDIFKILAGFAAFIGLASGLGVIAIGLLFGFATTSVLPWIIPVIAISTLYFTLDE